MKRNGGDMRDELGYIPPPNRKLPPVPGTQYNTCDRIKRGNYTIQTPYFLLLIFLTVDSSSNVCHVYLYIARYFFYKIWYQKKIQTLVDE